MKKKIILALAICSLILTAGVATVYASSVSDTRTNLRYMPDITIDYGEYSEENIPAAVKDEPYRIFPVYAEDVYGNELTVTVKAYIHYHERTKSLVTVENGCVIPRYFGIYTVEYSARDEFGNVGYAVYNFNCDPIERLSASVSGGDRTVQAGYEAELGGYEYENAVGSVSVGITATLNGQNIVYDLTGKTSFIPLYVGQYEVKYVFRDYNLTITESYELTVTGNNGAIVYEDPVIPKYFIVGVSYELPKATCYQFSTGKPISIEPTVSVRYGTDRPETLSSYTFTPSKAGALTFIYSVPGDSRQYVSKAIDTGFNTNNFDVTKYFYSENATVSVNSNYMIVNTETDGAKVEFINSLDSYAFNFVFSVNRNAGSFSKLEFFIASASDEHKTLKISYTKTSDRAGLVVINDLKYYKCDDFLSPSTMVDLNYSDKTKSLTIGTVLSVDLSSYFDGFGGEKIYFSFALGNLGGAAGLNVYSINNQPFYRLSQDEIAPRVYFDAYPKGIEQIGNVITVDRIYVCDVLDPNFTVSYGIISPSGDYVVDVNNVLLDENNADYRKTYSFVANEFGNYLVSIDTQDSLGNSDLLVYAISVADTTGPIVLTKWELKDKLKIGEAVTISELVIKDTGSEVFTVNAFIIQPNMRTMSVEVGAGYAFRTAGTYVLCYTVSDESGNVTLYTHTFIVGQGE